MRPLAPLLLAASLAACAAAAPQRPRQCALRAPVANAAPPPPPAPLGAASADAPASAPPSRPMVVEAQVTSSGGGAESPAEPFEDCTPAPEPADPVGAQEDAIRRHQGTLASAVSACREVCSASGGICAAAAEICRLTGDAHDRCARARGACTDASRRRDGQCPACPSP
jgi:hypothetical protein